jgi:murein DD-endopeptidase MepM/ murein hydrolase activator NlpD
MRRWVILVLFATAFFLTGWVWENHLADSAPRVPSTDELLSPTALSRLALSWPVNTTFDFPVRPPHGENAWIAQKFAQDFALGENWNTALGDGDLGEPVFSCGDGCVTMANDFQAVYGKVVMIAYRITPDRPLVLVEMMYSNLQDITVTPGAFVKRGQKIGTMGNAQGTNLAHLHWEVRTRTGLGLGGGYSQNNVGWIDPRAFVTNHGRGQSCRARELTFLDYERWGND